MNMQLTGLAGASDEAAAILSILPPDLSRFTAPADYFTLLSRSADEQVRVGAFASLIDQSQLDPARWEEALVLARHGAVANRLSPFFTRQFEHALALRAIERFETGGGRYDPVRSLKAAAAADDARMLEQANAQFLETGDHAHLLVAATYAETLGGWRASLPWYARALLLAPVLPSAGMGIFEKLANANEIDLGERFVAFLNRRQLLPVVSAVYAGRLAHLGGDYDKAAQQLGRVPVDRLPPALRNRYFQFRAETAEKQGQFKDAYQLFVKMNEPPPNTEKRQPVALYMKQADLMPEGPVPDLPPDPRPNYAVMLGFPRSGTTLLENALAAHPDIATFEELPGMAAASAYWRRVGLDTLSGPALPSALLEGRERYYAELDRRSAPSRALYVDKMPLYTQFARTFRTIFPDKKIIFSIRHPHDVVLSCFKQNFKINRAMAQFQDFENTCLFYDAVMDNWFRHYTMETPNVLYSRYDRLVTDFESEMRGILGFLGLDWHEEVRAFSDKAQERRTRTPSYRKVRQGLSLGVQSSREGYRFLFNSPAARKLDRWVAFFGFDPARN